MTPQDFCYWLHGRAELLPDQPPSAEEWKMIREHLALTFNKATPKAKESLMDALKAPSDPWGGLSGGGYGRYECQQAAAKQIKEDDPRLTAIRFLAASRFTM